MKQIAVTFPCTMEQKEKLIQSVPSDEAVFLFTNENKILRSSHIVIGEPELVDILENPQLEWVQMTWAGTDKYTVNPGFPKHVRLCNMSGAFGVIMSEYAIGAILSLYRHFFDYRLQQMHGLWKDAGKEDSLCGKTVLFLGTGDICSHTARRLKAFGTVNIGLKRELSGEIDGFDKLDTLSNIDAWLLKADIVICALPNKPNTRMLLTKERLLSMKKEATLLNMGRGSLLSCDDLNEVLDAGHLKYVVLDVTNPEPLPPEHPLWKQERVMLTPHISGPSINHCPDTQERIVDACCENLQRYFSGKPLLHEIMDSDFEYIRIN